MDAYGQGPTRATTSHPQDPGHAPAFWLASSMSLAARAAFKRQRTARLQAVGLASLLVIAMQCSTLVQALITRAAANPGRDKTVEGGVDDSRHAHGSEDSCPAARSMRFPRPIVFALDIAIAAGSFVVALSILCVVACCFRAACRPCFFLPCRSPLPPESWPADESRPCLSNPSSCYKLAYPDASQDDAERTRQDRAPCLVLSMPAA